MRGRSYRRSRFGRRGGDGPNKGKTAIHYVGVAPDGRELKRRVFSDLGPSVKAYISPYHDKWLISIDPFASEPRFNDEHVVTLTKETPR